VSHKNILKIAIPRPLDTLFDYLPLKGTDAGSIPIGVRVLVPFGRSKVVGFVAGVGQSHLPTSKLKAIDEIIDKEPLFGEHASQFLCIAKEYYHHS